MKLLPLSKAPKSSQIFELDEDGNEYTIELEWVSKFQRFYMAVKDSSGNYLIRGMKLINGAPINLSRVTEGPKGVFIVAGRGDLQRDSFETGQYVLNYTDRETSFYPEYREYYLSDDWQSNT